MPFRFYRRFRAGPFRMNLSKRGVSWSVGGRGAWLTFGRGRVRESIGLPGTGLGYYRQVRLQRGMERPAVEGSSRAVRHPLTWLVIALLVIAALMTFGGH